MATSKEIYARGGTIYITRYAGPEDDRWRIQLDANEVKLSRHHAIELTLELLELLTDRSEDGDESDEGLATKICRFGARLWRRARQRPEGYAKIAHHQAKVEWIE